MNRGLTWLTEAAQSSTDECLLYPFTPSQRYGLVYREGRMQLAHRVVLILAGREQPPGTEARHKVCGVSRCCNPRHLAWSTHAENEADKRRHGTLRLLTGEAAPSHKMTAEQVAEIRASTESQRVIARRLGISARQVGRIRRREAWA